METTDAQTAERHQSIRQAVRDVCRSYPDSYWRELDRETRYPHEFIDELTRLGWLAVLIPEEYGGDRKSVV